MDKKELISSLEDIISKLKEEEKEIEQQQEVTIPGNFIGYFNKDNQVSSFKLFNMSAQIGDELIIGSDKYVVVNKVYQTMKVPRYYLMPKYNLDVVQMHHNDNWTCFEDTDMYQKTIPAYFQSIKENIDRYDSVKATLASKEDIFDEEKAFPYFKALFKEGREKYIREFGKDSYFWLRSVVSSTYFAGAGSYGGSSGSYASHSYGFRPLILIG